MSWRDEVRDAIRPVKREIEDLKQLVCGPNPERSMSAKEWDGFYNDPKNWDLKSRVNLLECENKKLKAIVAELVDYVYDEKRNK
jgi:hypothetical protein